MLYELAGTYSPGQFFTLGDVPVTLHFDSDGSITDPGFRVYFYMGEASPGTCKLLLFEIFLNSICHI